MAKLSAHGQELARASFERETPPHETGVSWERVERTLHSDMKVLEKRTVKFRPSAYDPVGERHDWGWKLRGKCKPELTPAMWVAHYRAKGWTVNVANDLVLA